jgi:hypothetical protein
MMEFVVHAHPRTASVSLSVYLQKKKIPTYHAHYLVDRQHRWHNKHIYAEIIDKGKDAFKVITIVRDPDEVNASVKRRWPDLPLDPTSVERHMKEEVEAFWGREPDLVLRYDEIERWPEILYLKFGIPVSRFPWYH